MATKGVLSNVDLIRKFVFENQPVAIEEISQAILEQMEAASSVEVARDRYVMPVLQANDYYAESDGKWSTVQDLMPEYKVLREVFEDERKLLYDREVRSRVAKKLGKKVITIVLDLSLAKELKQFRNHWGLAEWIVANDQAAELLEQHPAGMNERELQKQIIERFKLPADLVVLHLKGDVKKRFVQEKKLWYLKEHYAEMKRPAEESQAIPEFKAGDIDSLLEGSFLQAQDSRGDKGKDQEEGDSRGRMKKLLKKQAQQVIEHRQEQKVEDLAAKLSQTLDAAGVDEYDVQSFQRVEPASKERGLNAKERDEIQSFVDQLLKHETVGVGAPLAAVVNAPLSAKKVLDVLRLKYINYTRDRAVIPAEYNRLLVELVNPRINDQILHPSCFEGLLSVELFSFLFDRTEGAAWALADGDTQVEVVQPDGARYSLSMTDSALIEKARDRFMVSQVDLLNHFLNYSYTGIEADKALARAARVYSRLSGFENAYIVSKDFLAELPEVFGLPANPENEIKQRFDCVIGNFTFAQDANLAANYLHQSLSLLKPGGKLGVFVLQELLALLKEHALLSDFLSGRIVSHVVRLPVIEGRHKVTLWVIEQKVDEEDPEPDFIVADVSDFKSANTLIHALQDPEAESTAFSRVEQRALATAI